MKKTMAINFGSTSSKLAYYEDDQCIDKTSISHPGDVIASFRSAHEQSDFRKEVVLQYMKEHQIALNELTAFVARGPLTEPLNCGVYRINEAMVEQAMSGRYGHHATNLACKVVYDLTQGTEILPLTVDVPCADEMAPLARYSGVKDIERITIAQVLNQKAMGRAYAESVHRNYEDLNLIIAVFGGGITIVPHKKGVMVDSQDGVLGEGPFSTNRSGSLPPGKVIELCYSGEYTKEEMFRKINGEAGLKGYLGTTDCVEVEKRIEQGDEYAREVLEAMCYQISKEIGAMATVLKGDVDAILLCGGMAHSDLIVSLVSDAVSFIAPIVVQPGEREMETLCLRGYKASLGEEEIQEFIPKCK